jgi:hypothetical protein
MSIPAKQIGWSNESNLLWYILKQLNKLTSIIFNLKPKYKVYTALLTQSGINAPVATVLENTLGATITYSRVSDGIYTITTDGIFTSDKTWATISTPSYDGDGPYLLNIGRTNNTQCTIYSYVLISGNFTLNDLKTGTDKVSIEIRVYN